MMKKLLFFLAAALLFASCGRESLADRTTALYNELQQSSQGYVDEDWNAQLENFRSIYSDYVDELEGIIAAKKFTADQKQDLTESVILFDEIFDSFFDKNGYCHPSEEMDMAFRNFDDRMSYIQEDAAEVFQGEKLEEFYTMLDL